jgi:hypothetical protein
MIKTPTLVAALFLMPVLAIAEPPQAVPPGHVMGGHMMHGSKQQPATTPSMPATEPGQGAFAVIAEIVGALASNPDTDWSKVNIRRLREHLRDMDVVMVDANARSEDIPKGLRFIVTGDARVAPSIRRMALAHARIMNGVDGWSYAAKETPNGAVMEVRVPARDLPKLKGLGFFGVMAGGMHHQPHHWMMATGENPHQGN